MAPVYEVPLADMPPKVINLTFRHQSSFFLGFVVTSILKDDIPEDYDYSHFEYINKVINLNFGFVAPLVALYLPLSISISNIVHLT